MEWTITFAKSILERALGRCIFKHIFSIYQLMSLANKAKRWAEVY